MLKNITHILYAYKAPTSETLKGFNRLHRCVM